MEKVNRMPSAVLLAKVAAAWHLDVPMVALRSVTNHVCVSGRGGEKCVVRFSNSGFRSAAMICSELTFIEAVKKSTSIRVVDAWMSDLGKQVETLCDEDGTTFHVCVFSYAAGIQLKNNEDVNAIVLESWGTTLASLHNFSETYHSPAGVAERPEWHDESVLLAALSVQSQDLADTAEVRSAVEQLHRLASMGVTEKTYGTIHADLHLGNFFVDKGSLILFDFDDACRHWYLYDLAVSITSLMQYRRTNGANEATVIEATEDLFCGYLKLRHLSNSERNLLFGFVRYRFLLIRLWWKAKMEKNEGTKHLETWGLEFDPWSIKICATLPTFQ